MYGKVSVVLLVLILVTGIVPALGKPIVTAPEDVYQALTINARDYSRGDPFEWNNDIKILSFKLTDVHRESSGRVVFSFIVLLKINHHTALHGHPTSGEDDWEEPWNYQFVICIGYGEKRVVDIAIDDYFGLTSSKKPFDKLSFNRVGTVLTSYKSMEARWINKSSKFNTLEELIAYYKSSTESYSNKSYWVSGVLEIKAVDVKFPLTVRYEDLDRIKLYAAIRGWSGPGDMSGPLWWLLAYDTMDITDLFRQKLQGSQEAPSGESGGTGGGGGTSVPSYTPSGGYGEKFGNAFLRYRLHFHANVTGYTGERSIDNWVVSDAEYHMRIKDFSNGDFYVNASTVGLKVKSSDPDMESLAYNVYSGLNMSGQTSISAFSRGLQYFIRFMDSYLSRLNIYDVEHDGVFTWYNGVPAVKYTVTGSGTTYLEGDSYNYEVNVTSYYDTFMGLPLYINGTVHLFDRKEDRWIDLHLTLSVELLDGLNYFPRQEEIPSVTCILVSENQVYVGLEVSNARLLDARIDDDNDLLITVSGRGSGSLIIVVGGDDGVERVLIDGEPVNYLELIDIKGKTIIMVPLTFSEHQVKISFTSQVNRLGGPVGQPGEETGVQTSPKNTIASQATQPGSIGESTEKPGTQETVVSPSILGDLWLIIAIILVVVAVIGGLVLVFTRGRRRRQPYYMPPPPPPY